VNPIHRGVIVDACTLKNFAVVDRVSLLRKRRRGLTAIDSEAVLADC